VREISKPQIWKVKIVK